ncbi:hypothetical protein [Streptomyces sp. UG1]|uniref:hypothetical protein n=1 Tax=Streptomyces sp. UG1 TaxID=3417652 RepID=UPI003CF1F24C
MITPRKDAIMTCIRDDRSGARRWTSRSAYPGTGGSLDTPGAVTDAKPKPVTGGREPRALRVEGVEHQPVGHRVGQETVVVHDPQGADPRDVDVGHPVHRMAEGCGCTSSSVRAPIEGYDGPAGRVPGASTR